MSLDTDVAAIVNHRQPVDDQSVADAAHELGDEQITRWAEEMVCKTFELRTTDNKVPWLSAAHRVAILLAAAEWQIQLETR